MRSCIRDPTNATIVVGAAPLQPLRGSAPSLECLTDIHPSFDNRVPDWLVLVVGLRQATDRLEPKRPGVWTSEAVAGAPA